ncbi:MAG: GIY-YIG nuclease family protein [Verrucomicrobiia bacterium]
MKFYYVYILQSGKDLNRFYAGFTKDFKERLAEHNSGKSIHTRALRPWRIKTCIAFTNRQSALDFERYLQTASGRAFAKKRLQ